MFEKAKTAVNKIVLQAFLGKACDRTRSHARVHASQYWEVRLIVRLFTKNQLLFTTAPGISNHG